jgi:hypothetical protein
MVEAQGCPGLAAAAGESWPVEQSSWSNIRKGTAPTKGRSLRVKAPGVKISGFGEGVRGIAGGCREGGYVSGLLKPGLSLYYLLAGQGIINENSRLKPPGNLLQMFNEPLQRVSHVSVTQKPSSANLLSFFCHLLS